MSTLKRKEKKHDKAVDLTFPASDPAAHGKPTSTEAPGRPADREAPRITKEQIDQSRRGKGLNGIARQRRARRSP